ncbi:hypothetical protein N658DRAFT_245399 [Parathielavia hyrcaniae]|uniref:Uncharacterized protein n=1 Tax=Parathielavia hyrcaniae TaxID=113614 RepID=A0AAN6Q9H4_9PEZI|nr:hypothetical protein N658DRAFT_245399 [Parathielavia hyrcaniae]
MAQRNESGKHRTRGHQRKDQAGCAFTPGGPFPGPSQHSSDEHPLLLAGKLVPSSWSRLGTLDSLALLWRRHALRATTRYGGVHGAPWCKANGRGYRFLGGSLKVGRTDMSPGPPRSPLAGLVSIPGDGWLAVPEWQGCGTIPRPVPCSPLQGTGWPAPYSDRNLASAECSLTADTRDATPHTLNPVWLLPLRRRPLQGICSARGELPNRTQKLVSYLQQPL